MKTICFANHKGGVGKTTSVSCIGAGLALKGYRTLLIDFDSQGNLSQGLGVRSERDIYGVMIGRYKISPVQVVENLFVVPASPQLRNLELDLNNRADKDLRLKQALSSMPDRFDFVLIDLPPALGLLTTNGFCSADEVIVPMTPQYYAVQGIVTLTEAISDIRRTKNPNLILSGILVNMFNKQKNVHREIVQAIEKTFGDKVFETKIRLNVSIEESSMSGQNLFRYAPESIGAKDYLSVVEEILKREKM